MSSELTLREIIFDENDDTAVGCVESVWWS